MHVVRIKVCGITRTEDALAAAAAGADAIGFMFHPGSPRYLTPSEASTICTSLPPLITRVGVFVNATAEQINAVRKVCPLDVLQLHGEESPAFCLELNARIIKAFQMKDTASVERLRDFPVDAWLLDTYVEGQRGGTGRAFNWDLATQAKTLGRPIILAGGLNPTNVAKAVRHVRPYAVDVSSGVESAPGRKEPALVQAFVRAVREAFGN